MKASETDRPHPPQPRRGSPLLPVATFLLGAVLTALWFHRPPAGPLDTAVAGISDSAKSALAQLPAPVTIHYYSLLSGNSDPALQGFAGRTGKLLNDLQDASGGKLRLLTIDIPAETNATAASAQGLQAFNLEKGEADFLGVSITSGKNQETMARLDPVYEPALEADLVRAILRVAVLPPAAPPAPEVAKPSGEIVASIHRLIPDVAATDTNTASQIFHAEFLKELSDAGTDIDTHMQVAQERATAAQAGGSPADQEAAQKNLALVQRAQSEKIRQIAAELRIRQEVFQQMKDEATNEAK